MNLHLEVLLLARPCLVGHRGPWRARGTWPGRSDLPTRASAHTLARRVVLGIGASRVAAGKASIRAVEGIVDWRLQLKDLRAGPR